MKNNLPPFKFFMLENFPFIEADFDALTNYELLCKVVEYINKIGKQNNELVTEFNKLYEYVKNYFDNLDVTEDINNKLDEMASDGTLADIINKKLLSQLNSEFQLCFIPSTDNLIGLSAVLHCDDETAIYDFGVDTSCTALRTFLKNKGWNKIKYIMVSHPHADHTGGLNGAGILAFLNDLYFDFNECKAYLGCLNIDWLRWIGDNYSNQLSTIVSVLAKYC